MKTELSRGAVIDTPVGNPETPTGTGKKYLYAIVASGESRIYPALGIDGGDVYTIEDGNVAAVVSNSDRSKIRPERAHLASHQAVLRRLMEDTSPLPMAFASIAAGPREIHRILAKNRRAFEQRLQRVEGKVEMGLRVGWDVPNIFEYFVSVHPELRVARDRLVGTRHGFTQEEKIELGRMFDRLLTGDREEHTRKVTRVLTPACAELKASPCRGEREVMKLACLVRRDGQDAFSAAIFEAAKRFDNNFTFDYNGPWAPHNFVEIDMAE